MHLKDTDKGFDNFSKLLAQMAKIKIEAGVFSDAGSNPKSGQSIVEYAYYNEYGTEHIPARPFMRITADDKNDHWSNLVADCFDKALVNEGKAIEHDLRRVGEQMVADIKETISSNISPANAPATVKRKGSSRTLIDTGALRAAISSRVSKG